MSLVLISWIFIGGLSVGWANAQAEDAERRTDRARVCPRKHRRESGAGASAIQRRIVNVADESRNLLGLVHYSVLFDLMRVAFTAFSVSCAKIELPAPGTPAS